MTPKKIPLRRCNGCGESKPKKELVRVVRAGDGTVSLDLTGKKPGRGGEHPGRNLRRHGRRDREGRGAKRRDACRVISCSHFLFAARRGPW